MQNMKVEKTKKTNQSKSKKTKIKKKKGPPAKIKLAEAMRQLLKNKDFQSITTDEIASAAGANEALIYRYFGDKRGLLHFVLGDYMRGISDQILEKLDGLKGPLERLAFIVRSSFDAYCNNRIFAKIVLVEVRNFPGYFESDTYALIKEYAQLMENTIKAGAAAGVIRNDVPPAAIRDMIIGGIEHVVLPSLFFGKTISAENASRDLLEVVFSGISLLKKNDDSHVEGKSAASR